MLLGNQQLFFAPEKWVIFMIFYFYQFQLYEHIDARVQKCTQWDILHYKHIHTLNLLLVKCVPDVCVIAVSLQMFDWIMHNKGLFLAGYTEIGNNHPHAMELQTQHNHFAMNCMVRRFQLELH